MFPALHMKKNQIVFPLSCAFKAAKAWERIWETVVRTFPSLPGQALYADNPAVLFLNLLLCNEDTSVPFSGKAL